MRKRITDEMSTILETCIDQIFENADEELLETPAIHMIDREFRMMFRNKLHEHMRNKRE